MNSIKGFEKMSIDEKQKLLDYMKVECLKMETIEKKSKFANKIVDLFPYLRNFDLDIEGIKNVPQTNCLFLFNHSNSHDFFIMSEMYKELGIKASVLAASDSQSRLEQIFFSKFDAIYIDRNSKEESINGMNIMCNKMLNGMSCAIFGEGTWNLHPYKLMHNIKLGPVKVAAISNRPIIPVIIEYEDVLEICQKEKDLYSRCIIVIGTPFIVNIENGFINETTRLQKEMIDMRKKLKQKLGRLYVSLDDVNANIYLNHTYLKKFGGVGFEFDSEYELPFIYFKQNEPHENEYCLSENGKLIPGITRKRIKKGEK